MKYLYVMCGCPGLGKSTWIKNHTNGFPGRTKIVSRDDIRFSIVKENEEYFSKEKQVFQKYINEIKDGLHFYETTIADATHLNEASRNKLLLSLGRSLNNTKIIAVVISGSLNTAIKQNNNRLGTRSYVPESAIRRMYKSYTEPKLEEGFDKIFIYDTKTKKYRIIESEK